jgi:protein SCO1
MKAIRGEKSNRILARVLPWLVGAGALVAGAVFAVSALRSHEVKFDAVDVTGADWGRNFQLRGHDGKPRSLADFRGKVVALYFGYTSCPDMCPTEMAKLGDAVRLLGREGDGVQGLFITVDPKRDTPQILAQYVPSFHPAFIGLYGDDEAIRRTAKEFKVHFQAQPPNDAGSYSVDHSGYILVFDPEGRLRLFIRPEASAESMAHDMRVLLEAARG